MGTIKLVQALQDECRQARYKLDRALMEKGAPALSDEFYEKFANKEQWQGQEQKTKLQRWISMASQGFMLGKGNENRIMQHTFNIAKNPGRAQAFNKLAQAVQAKAERLAEGAELSADDINQIVDEEFGILEQMGLAQGKILKLKGGREVSLENLKLTKAHKLAVAQFLAAAGMRISTVAIGGATGGLTIPLLYRAFGIASATLRGHVMAEQYFQRMIESGTKMRIEAGKREGKMFYDIDVLTDDLRKMAKQLSEVLQGKNKTEDKDKEETEQKQETKQETKQEQAQVVKIDVNTVKTALLERLAFVEADLVNLGDEGQIEENLQNFYQAKEEIDLLLEEAAQKYSLDRDEIKITRKELDQAMEKAHQGYIKLMESYRRNLQAFYIGKSLGSQIGVRFGARIAAEPMAEITGALEKMPVLGLAPFGILSRSFEARSHQSLGRALFPEAARAKDWVEGKGQWHGGKEMMYRVNQKGGELEVKIGGKKYDAIKFNEDFKLTKGGVNLIKLEHGRTGMLIEVEGRFGRQEILLTDLDGDGVVERSALELDNTGKPKQGPDGSFVIDKDQVDELSFYGIKNQVDFAGGKYSVKTPNYQSIAGKPEGEAFLRAHDLDKDDFKPLLQEEALARAKDNFKNLFRSLEVEVTKPSMEVIGTRVGFKTFDALRGFEQKFIEVPKIHGRAGRISEQDIWTNKKVDQALQDLAKRFNSSAVNPITGKIDYTQLSSEQTAFLSEAGRKLGRYVEHKVVQEVEITYDLSADQSGKGKHLVFTITDKTDNYDGTTMLSAKIIDEFGKERLVRFGNKIIMDTELDVDKIGARMGEVFKDQYTKAQVVNIEPEMDIDKLETIDGASDDFAKGWYKSAEIKAGQSPADAFKQQLAYLRQKDREVFEKFQEYFYEHWRDSFKDYQYAPGNVNDMGKFLAHIFGYDDIITKGTVVYKLGYNENSGGVEIQEGVVDGQGIEWYEIKTLSPSQGDVVSWKYQGDRSIPSGRWIERESVWVGKKETNLEDYEVDVVEQQAKQRAFQALEVSIDQEKEKMGLENGDSLRKRALLNIESKRASDINTKTFAFGREQWLATTYGEESIKHIAQIRTDLGLQNLELQDAQAFLSDFIKETGSTNQVALGGLKNKLLAAERQGYKFLPYKYADNLFDIWLRELESKASGDKILVVHLHHAGPFILKGEGVEQYIKTQLSNFKYADGDTARSYLGKFLYSLYKWNPDMFRKDAVPKDITPESLFDAYVKKGSWEGLIDPNKYDDVRYLGIKTEEAISAAPIQQSPKVQIDANWQWDKIIDSKRGFEVVPIPKNNQIQWDLQTKNLVSKDQVIDYTIWTNKDVKITELEPKLDAQDIRIGIGYNPTGSDEGEISLEGIINKNNYQAKIITLYKDDLKLGDVPQARFQEALDAVYRARQTGVKMVEGSDGQRILQPDPESAGVFPEFHIVSGLKIENTEALGMVDMLVKYPKTKDRQYTAVEIYFNKHIKGEYSYLSGRKLVLPEEQIIQEEDGDIIKIDKQNLLPAPTQSRITEIEVPTTMEEKPTFTEISIYPNKMYHRYELQISADKELQIPDWVDVKEKEIGGKERIVISEGNRSIIITKESIDENGNLEVKIKADYQFFKNHKDISQKYPNLSADKLPDIIKKMGFQDKERASLWERTLEASGTNLDHVDLQEALGRGELLGETKRIGEERIVFVYDKDEDGNKADLVTVGVKGRLDGPLPEAPVEIGGRQRTVAIDFRDREAITQLMTENIISNKDLDLIDSYNKTLAHLTYAYLTEAQNISRTTITTIYGDLWDPNSFPGLVERIKQLEIVQDAIKKNITSFNQEHGKILKGSEIFLKTPLEQTNFVENFTRSMKGGFVSGLNKESNPEKVFDYLNNAFQGKLDQKAILEKIKQIMGEKAELKQAA